MDAKTNPSTDMDIDHQTGTVISGDVTLFYRRFGQESNVAGKTPILIVHGLSYFSYDWIGPASRLAADREVVAMDMRGFGESTWSPERDYGLRTLANDVIAVLDALGWEKAVLMGHSMGGRVCLVTSSWYPDRAAGLVCVDFAPDVEAAGRRKVAERIGRQPDRFASVAEALAYHGEDANAAPNSAVYQRYDAFLRKDDDGYVLRRDLHYRDNFKKVLETGKSAPAKVDLWGMLSGLVIPVLMMRGTASDMFGPQTVKKCRQANPNVTAVEVDGSHDIAGDNPDGLVDTVGSFLTQTGL